MRALQASASGCAGIIGPFSQGAVVGEPVRKPISDRILSGMAVSVVSHGHDALLEALLVQLASTGNGVIERVILTHNLTPEQSWASATRWPFALIEIVNARPQGFGRNHNRASEQVGDSELLAVLNPDVSWEDAALWESLRKAAEAPDAGCVFPRLLNADGSVQDQVRAAVTPWALARRRLLRQPDAHADWVSAAFWVLPIAVFRRLGGFDERYHMYCEDVDFCLRLQLHGWQLQGIENNVRHEARRASHSDPRHLVWHVASLLRLWCSDVLWRYVRQRGRHSLHVRWPSGQSLKTGQGSGVNRAADDVS